HEHVVVVEVDVEPASRHRRQVGVDLDRLVQLEGGVVGEAREGRVGQVQPLEGDGGTVPVAVDDAVGRGEIGQVAVADSGASGHLARVGGGTSGHESERRTPG